MLTSFSVNSVSSRSRVWRSPSPRPRRSDCERVVRAMPIPSEVETALAGGIGQGLDPAMKQIRSAIEHDALDPRRLRSFSDQLADGACGSHVGAVLEAPLETAVEARRRCEGSAGRVIDNLRI